MRFLLAALPILALVTEGFGQTLPVTSIVTGRPFSADKVIIENPKPNVRNVRPMKTIRIYRDSAGRTREDVSIPRDAAFTQVVNIQDPVAGVFYYLDTESKIARRLVFPRPATPGLDPSMNASGPPGVAVTFSSSVKDYFHGVRTTSEPLGTQFINGSAADGRRITSVSPDSTPGCDENVAVSESWYSPELRVVLLEKRSNCIGDGTTRLEHINRAEPDALLFQAPSDYTTVDQGWSAAQQQHEVISLERTACFGSCPVFTVRIDSSGSITYEGAKYVATQGTQTSSITTDQFRDLHEAFAGIHFFELHDEYRVGPGGAFRTDQPTALISLIENDKSKVIRDYDYAPLELRSLERQIERTANVHRWIHDKTKRLTLDEPAAGAWMGGIEDLKNEPAVWADLRANIKPGLVPLMQAAGLGDSAGIHEALRSGESIDISDETGWTALMLASVAVKPETVSLLLDSGASVDQKDSHGNTALIGASAVRFNMGNEPEILRILLSKGANVESTNDLGESALMWAAKAGNARAIDVLLKSGAKPQRTDQSGHDALFYLMKARSANAFDRALVSRYDEAAAVLDKALKQ
jgi:hypothetical protein